MFRYRQSSLISRVGRVPLFGGYHPPSFCVQMGEYLSAARTPSHLGAGFGSRQRRSPSGGAAKGTPLKTMTSGVAPAAPEIEPLSTFTGVVIEADADRAGRLSSATARNNRMRGRITFPSIFRSRTGVYDSSMRDSDAITESY